MIAALLALVAAALLAIGYFADVQALGAAALVVAALSLVLLLLGTFRRGSDAVPVEAPAADAPPPFVDLDTAPASIDLDKLDPRSNVEMPAPEAPPPDQALAATATDNLVLVSPGRRRYHRPGCELIGDREVEHLTEDEAREEGFSACSRCAG